MRTWLFGVCAAGALLAGLPADAPAKSQIGGAVLGFPLSVRQIGSGFVDVGENDVMRAWSNPSLLCDQENESEVAVSGGSIFDGLQTAAAAGGGRRIGGNLVAAVLVSYYGTGAEEIDANGDVVPGGMRQDTVATGFSAGIGSGTVSIGGTAKYVYEGLAGESLGELGFDLGARVGGDGFAVTVVGRNIALTGMLPGEVKAGVSWALPGRRISVGAECVKVESLGIVGGAGASWWPVRTVGIRCGVTGLGDEGYIRISAGLSFRYRAMNIDYALVTHPLGLSNRASVGYSF